jgi:hypothetical protein
VSLVFASTKPNGDRIPVLGNGYSVHGVLLQDRFVAGCATFSTAFDSWNAAIIAALDVFGIARLCNAFVR